MVSLTLPKGAMSRRSAGVIGFFKRAGLPRARRARELELKVESALKHQGGEVVDSGDLDKVTHP